MLFEKLYWKKITLPRRPYIIQLSLISLLFFALICDHFNSKNFLHVKSTLFPKVSAVAFCINNNATHVSAQDSINTLYAFSLLPVPQQVSFSAKTFLLNNKWFIEKDNNVENQPAWQSLIEGLNEQKIHLKILPSNAKANGSFPVIRFMVKAGAVPIGKTTDTNRVALERQAYRLGLNSAGITITANAPQGVYYGVQTLLQLIRSQKEKVLLPEGEIADWPDLNVRMIYWDDAHHLEKMEALKRIIRQASYFKINAFTIKLEGHFQYKSAPAIIEPYALSARDYQELTDYAKAHYVELVPYLDAPAHVSFILKHQEYVHLRLFSNNNYQFSVTNRGTEKLLKGMFSDLINSNKGEHFILLSTDEAYYTGKGGDEAEAAKALGGNGKLLAQFIKRISDELHRQGRTVLFWGEFPLTVNDIPALPSHLVNGVYDREIAGLFKQYRIRQFIYTPTQGDEPVFPNYYPQNIKDTGRVAAMLKDITSAIDERQSAFMGVLIAGWGDAGLHPETFWLGYAAGTAAGWNHRTVTAVELTTRFYHSFYGPSAFNMDEIYRLLSTQAAFYDKSWDWVASDLRKPILGNSFGIFDKPRPAKDQSLPVLPLPSNNSGGIYNWDTANIQRMKRAEQFLKENDELQDLLKRNIRVQDHQQYNLEVLTSVAALCRQSEEMLVGLKRINNFLKAASASASVNAASAVVMMDSALNIAATIKSQRDKMLAMVTQVWYKDWQPLVRAANGRRFLLQADDIKDHQPGRTIDLSYLIYRQLHYPLGKWAEEVKKIRNEYARKNHLPLREEQLEWERYK